MKFLTLMNSMVPLLGIRLAFFELGGILSAIESLHFEILMKSICVGF